MFGLSFWEIGLILLVALLVLGPQRLPGFLKTVGKGLRELRRASGDLRSAIEEPLDEVTKPLKDMRDDLVDAVYSMEDEVESAAKEGEDKLLTEGVEDPMAIDIPEPDPVDDKEQAELDERREEVERLYAEAGAESEQPEQDEPVSSVPPDHTVAQHEPADGATTEDDDPPADDTSPKSSKA